jgi:PEP-CTERM motif
MIKTQKLKLYAVTGVLCVALSGQALADGNLVANPGFETGDFTGWTQGGNTEGTAVVPSQPPFFPSHSGNFLAILGPVGSDGTLSQDVATTAGQSYTFSWFLGSDGGTPSDFSAIWNGAIIFSETNLPPTSGAYTAFTFTDVATGPTTIMFSFRDDPGGLSFDDVSVTASAAIPEPSSLVLAGIGILTFAGSARRRRLRAKV